MTARCEPSLGTMITKERPVVLYDIEVFPNCFHCTCKDSESHKLYKFEISSRKNQLEELVDFFYINRTDHIMCGYNNKHYDDIIINYIIHFCNRMKRLGYSKICSSLYYLSKEIISSEKTGNIDKIKVYKYANYFYSFDLMMMLYSAKQQKSLKEIEILLHMPNVQEYEGSFDLQIQECDIDAMIEYNVNDVEATETLLNKVKEDVELRLEVEKEWGFDALSMSGVRFGEEVLLRKTLDITNTTKDELKTRARKVGNIRLGDIILPFIQYSNPKLKEVLSDVKNATCNASKSDKKQKNYEKKFVLSNICYSIGEGGIHTINEPRVYKPTDEQFIGHSDVTSMYPSLAIINHWLPVHLGKDFWNVYSALYKERLTAKRNGELLKSKAFKQALNALTGKMQQESSWAYDPLNVYKIRINGQLILLMLVDRLLALNCKIVQVNTDGVVYIADKSARLAIADAIKEVEQLTQLTFESDDYESFYQYDVNNYFGVRKGYSQSGDPRLIEKKGRFITEIGLSNSMTPVVISKAVINYFLNNEPIDKFIKKDRDIRDFLMSQSVNKESKVEHGGKQIQRINRYYASSSGYYLIRIKDKMYENRSETKITEYGVRILNKIDATPIENRHLNYQYYISKAKKIASEFVNRQLTIFDD
nr:MAG TPA: DNA polymerase [Caudoviricetes sp.]